MAEHLISAFITLFVIIDPVGLAPLFASLTSDHPPAAIRRTALRGTAIGAIVLLIFAFVGEPLMQALGLGLDAFRIAGGALLFMLAIDVVFERRAGRREKTAHDAETEIDREDVSVFPLAIPLIAGPGAITSVLLLMTRAHGDPLLTAGLIATLLSVLLLTLIALLAAPFLNRLIGVTAANVFSRVLGVLLAALAAQYVIDGLTGTVRAALATG